MTAIIVTPRVVARIIRLRVKRRMSEEEIARELDCSRTPIRRVLREHGLNRPAGRPKGAT